MIFQKIAITISNSQRDYRRSTTFKKKTRHEAPSRYRIYLNLLVIDRNFDHK